MKKITIVLLSLILLLGLVLTGCLGPKGETYLSYSWTSSPQYLYDDNPSTPSTVYNGEYFYTNEGSYYMEYTAWDGSSWWMTYSIEAKEGELFMMAGEDTYFEITLYSSGPTLWEWNEEYSSLVPAESDNETEPMIQKSDRNSNSIKLPKEGKETITKNGYQLTIEYGQIEEE